VLFENDTLNFSHSWKKSATPAELSRAAEHVGSRVLPLCKIFSRYACALFRTATKSEDIRKLVLCKREKGKMPMEIFREMEGAVSLKTIKRWKAMHVEGNDIMGAQYARPATAATAINVRKVEAKMSTRKIARRIGISNGNVHKILHKRLAVEASKRR
jgi:predicted transcriptional regulator